MFASEQLPREFGLLVKQSLYFDRYLKILAPELDIMSDARVGGFGGEQINGAFPETKEPSELVIDV